MSKLKKLNRLNKSKTLSAAMAVGLVVTNLVTVVPAFATNSSAESLQAMSISKVTASTTVFDKKSPCDIVVSMTSAYNLVGIKNGITTLKSGTDYTVDGTTVTIKAAYLSSQTVGTKSLKFDFDGGTDPYLRITVKDTSAALSMSKATFNQKSGSDIKVRVTLNGNTFIGVSNGGAPLNANTDYTVSGSYVTIKKSYLASLSNGLYPLQFNFNAGTNPVLNVTVTNSNVQTTAIYSASAVNGTVTAVFAGIPAGTPVISDFAITQTINGIGTTAVTPSALTMNGPVAALSVAPVVATTSDQSVVYSVSYKGGAAKTAAAFIVKSAADTVKPVITLNGSATMNIQVGSTFTDPGSTVTDNVDKNLVAVVSGAVDTSKAGTYVLKYDVSDSAGNAAVEVTRTVVVSDVVAPTTITGVSASTNTTVEVTFNNSLTSLPAASAFSIDGGLAVTGTAFKAGDTKNQIVVLTTSAQVDKNIYSLTYNGQTKPFAGVAQLANVLVSADQTDVTIDPSSNQLPKVQITAKLSGFPAGAEAVIHFTTSFGTIADVETTQGGVANAVLAPLETMQNQTARVTGEVVEVKNPQTGQSYPEYKNSAVQTVNVNFIIKDNNGVGNIQQYDVKTAYADQADRVYLKVSGGISGKMDTALNFQTEKLIASDTNLDDKAFYRALHDVIFSNMEDKVVKSADVASAKTALYGLLKDVTAKDLRNILYNDALNAHYTDVYHPLNATLDEYTNKTQLVNEINTLYANGTLDGILNYYKLLSKFVVLNNVQDTEAPQPPIGTPNPKMPVELLYKDSNDVLVLVLPGDRVNTNQKAMYLKDNASHQVVFTGDANTDGYIIKGDPTFKLEDSNNVKLMAVITPQTDQATVPCKVTRYLVQPQTSDSSVVTNVCPIPDITYQAGDGGIITGSTGTTVTNVPPSYVGTVKLTAINYTPPTCYAYKAPATAIADNTGKSVVDKLGELKVVFSESVITDDPAKANSVLNPNNWVIDGLNLGSDVVAKGYTVHIRLISTDSTKQLRDAVIITFEAKNADVDPNYSVERFIEDTVKGTHKLQVNSLADWAGETDSNNIVPTQELDYNGVPVTSGTAWLPGITTTSTTSKIGPWAGGDAFIMRAAAKDVAIGDGKDTIQILFSEPMRTDGNLSVLNKRNYRIDGLDIPVDGTQILTGIRGDAKLDQSPCGVTIVLPDGYLQGSAEPHMVSVNNVQGQDDGTDTLNDRVQLSYARGMQISNWTVDKNGKIVLGTGTASPVVLKDAAGNVIPITINNVYPFSTSITAGGQVNPAALQITAVGAWNPILGSVKVTVNDSSLVKKAFDGTTDLGTPLVNDATHVTVFCDAAPAALALAGADGTKVYPPTTPPVTTTLKVTAVGTWNPILGSVKVTVNDSSLVKHAYDGTTDLGTPLVNDATHVTVFCDAAPTALTLAGADGVKVGL